jgi:hypothetical protein
MDSKSIHGGKRANSGSKAKDGATGLRHVTVSLDEPTVSKAKRIGDNELSLGLRKAVKAYRLDKRTKGMT